MCFHIPEARRLSCRSSSWRMQLRGASPAGDSQIKVIRAALSLEKASEKIRSAAFCSLVNVVGNMYSFWGGEMNTYPFEKFSSVFPCPRVNASPYRHSMGNMCQHFTQEGECVYSTNGGLFVGGGNSQNPRVSPSQGFSW